jgi:hypothetical protein
MGHRILRLLEIGGGRARGRVCPVGSGFAGGPVAALWVTGGGMGADAWDR